MRSNNRLNRCFFTLLFAAMAMVAVSSGAAAEDGPIIVQSEGGNPAAPAALLRRAQGREALRIIVGLRAQVTEEAALSPQEVKAQRARLRQSQEALFSELGAETAGEGITFFETVPYVALNANAAILRRLLTNPRVESIQEDFLIPATLLQSVPLIGADAAAAAGFSGTGQVVAVLDTGVAKTHPMFAGGKVISEACYSSTVPGQSTSLCPGGAASSTAPGSGVNCPTSLSGCDHGTHVASIAVGNSASLKGVARGAKVIAIKVFSRTGNSVAAWNSDIINGLERVYALRTTYKIASANLSLGGGLYASNCDRQFPAFKAIITQLRAAKIATVIASGNDYLNGFVSAPGCISNAVTVGSTTKSDQLSPFSNHSQLVDLLAPGSDILAAVPGGTGVKSGTSMATPHVAGAWAILKQAKPGASVTVVQNALSCTGVPISRAGITKPRIDVFDALNVLRSPAPGCN